MRYFVIGLGWILVLCSCSNSETTYEEVEQIVLQWKGKTLEFPFQSVFTIYGKDPVDFPDENLWNGYKIVSYIDSTGCMSCKLQLHKWKEFISRIGDIPVLFYMFPKNKNEVEEYLTKCAFDYPVCIDLRDSLNILNHFPSNMEYQTFLLNKNNEVIAMGNPVLNYRIRDIYVDIIHGKSVDRNVGKEHKVTEIAWSVRRQTMGEFNWKKEQTVTFVCKNVGCNPLIIKDVVPSCSCLIVTYPKEQIFPGEEAQLQVKYKADYPGSFYKSFSVYCNTDVTPVRLYVSGNALCE